MATTFGGPLLWVQEQIKTTSYQVTNADNGSLFTNVGASGTVTFTLPTLANGVGCAFFFSAQVASQNLAITAPTGKLVAFNNAAGTTATYSTSANIIGSFCMVYLNAAGTFYVHVNLGGTTATIT